MRLVAILFLAVSACVVGAVLRDSPAAADHPACIVASVIDGDTFDCTDGTRVRLLQIDTLERGECGADWATAALANITRSDRGRLRRCLGAGRSHVLGVRAV